MLNGKCTGKTAGGTIPSGIPNGEEIDYSGLQNSFQELSDKGPLPLFGKISDVFSLLNVEGKAPQFDIPIGQWNLHIAFEAWTPLANALKMLLSIMAILATCFLLFKQWSF